MPSKCSAKTLGAMPWPHSPLTLSHVQCRDEGETKPTYNGRGAALAGESAERKACWNQDQGGCQRCHAAQLQVTRNVKLVLVGTAN
jgi:hypothetical protein